VSARSSARALLSWRALPIAGAVVGMLLVVPSLRVGWQVDDCVYRIIFTGKHAFSDVLPSWWDLYDNIGGVARTRRMMDIGLLPWWTLETVRLAWWRPVAALTFWMDYRLWPDLPVLMHLHSILWYGAVVLLAGMLYRRIMGSGGVAGLAVVLYAIDDAHGFSAGWLSNRNALLGAFFGLLAIIAHDRWRRGGWWIGKLVAPFSFALALLSAEAGVAAGAYLAAHAVCLDHGAPRRRLLALLPCATVVLLWHMTYRWLGYGVWGNAPVYLNPVLEPLRFGGALFSNGPTLLLMEWAPHLAALPGLASGGPGWPRWAVAVLFLGVTGVILFRLLRESEVARFWALGQVLAVISAAASFPQRRQLFFVGLGAIGLLAQFLIGLVDNAGWLPRRLTMRLAATALGAFLAVTHVILAPIEMPGASRGPVEFDRLLRDAAASIPDDRAIEGEDVVLLDIPAPFVPGYALAYRASQRQRVPMSLRALMSSAGPAELYRQDARTLVVEPDGGYLSQTWSRVVRGDGFPMRSGQRVDLPRLLAEVKTLTPDGRPAAVAFRFATDLEDPSLRWLRWDPGRKAYVSFAPPAIGEKARLP
jgi:hypothetical protein